MKSQFFVMYKNLAWAAEFLNIRVIYWRLVSHSYAQTRESKVTIRVAEPLKYLKRWVKIVARIRSS